MSSALRLILGLGALAAVSLAPAALGAQAAAPAKQGATTDSLAFPRQFVKWVLAGQGDSAYAKAGPQLQQTMQSAEEVKAMAARIQTRFGELQGTDAEVQFDEGELKVYIAAMRFAQAPETAAWVVVYSPSTKVVERANFNSLANVKTRYPQAKLP